MVNTRDAEGIGMGQQAQQKVSSSAKRLQSQMSEIVTEWTQRRGRQQLSKNDNAAGYLKRSVYELVRGWMRRSQPAPLRETLDELQIKQAQASGLEKSNMYRVLIALRDRGVEVKDPVRFAYELEYARRHDVPPAYVVGFLLQSTFVKSIAKRFREEDYESDIPPNAWRGRKAAKVKAGRGQRVREDRKECWAS